MQQLIFYQDYLDNGGIVIPEITSEDIANNIATIEEKFNKWLKYTQIQLNYILQDKLEEVDYNLLNIDEPYRRDIINILVVRLNRAFENNEIIQRDGNIQYSELGGINWSSTSDQNPYFWNLQELNIVEVSGLRDLVALYCDDHSSLKNYPANLTNEMYNRIIHDETLEIKKDVNKSNGLTSLNIKITDKIARKSEIPQVDDLKEKVKVNSKNIVNLEKIKVNKDLFDISIKEKVNKKTFNELSLKLNPESDRHKTLINKFNLKYKDTSQVKEWTFPNQESYNKVKEKKNDFEGQLHWDDKNLKVSFIWIENQDFVIKTFAILSNKFYDQIDFTSLATQEDLNKIVPPDISKEYFDEKTKILNQKINEQVENIKLLNQKIDNQSIKKWFFYDIELLKMGRLNPKAFNFFIENDIKISPGEGATILMTCWDGGYEGWASSSQAKGSSTNAFHLNYWTLRISEKIGWLYDSNMSCGETGYCHFSVRNQNQIKKIKVLMTENQKQEFEKLIS